MKSILLSKKECSVTTEVIEQLKTSRNYSEDFLAKVKENEKQVTVHEIIYLSRGLKILGYVVEPKNITRVLPCIIWNRGGSRGFASLQVGTCYRFMSDLARQVYIVFASNYSGSPGSEGVDDWGGKNLSNVLDLYKIIKKYKWADEKRIGMFGWSRGAAMTYMCLAKVKWIKAAVAGAGPADEVSAPKFRKGWREHQISLYGKSRQEQIKRSALYWPERINKKTPLLIMHDTGDWRVSAIDSIRMAEKLYEQKVPFRLHIYEGADHSLTEFRHEADQEIFNWFERFLKNKEPLPNLKLHGK